MHISSRVIIQQPIAVGEAWQLIRQLNFKTLLPKNELQ